MIKGFKNKGLKELWETGKSRKINQNLVERVKIILNTLEVSETKKDLNIPGFDFHGLRGHKPPRHSIHVNGPWCITFEFDDGEVKKIDLEQYH